MKRCSAVLGNLEILLLTIVYNSINFVNLTLLKKAGVIALDRKLLVVDSLINKKERSDGKEDGDLLWIG